MDAIKKLSSLFAKFPTVGSRTAQRFTMYLLSLSEDRIEELIVAIRTLRQQTKTCSFCFSHYEPARIAISVAGEPAHSITQSQQPDNNLRGGQSIAGGGDKSLCSICLNTQRDHTKLCIIEKEVDVHSIEHTGKYQGLYFVLGGTMNATKKSIEHLRINQLCDRIRKPASFGIPIKEYREIIIATNFTVEGQATATILERALKEIIPSTTIVTHLAKGLPMGSELEYADTETLESALEGRK